MTEVLAGIRRRLGTARSQKAPVVDKKLVALLEAAGDGLAGDRDRALLALGWFGAFRRAELVWLDVGDVVRGDEGLIVTLRCSKGDQEERRKSKGTSGGDEFTDRVLGASFLLLVCNADQGGGGVQSALAWNHELLHGSLERHLRRPMRHIEPREVWESRRCASASSARDDVHSVQEPRQLVAPQVQLEDWKSVITYARGRTTSIRIAWPSGGTSFSGGHVLIAGARGGARCRDLRAGYP